MHNVHMTQAEQTLYMHSLSPRSLEYTLCRGTLRKRDPNGSSVVLDVRSLSVLYFCGRKKKRGSLSYTEKNKCFNFLEELLIKRKNASYVSRMHFY